MWCGSIHNEVISSFSLLFTLPPLLQAAVQYRDSLSGFFPAVKQVKLHLLTHCCNIFLSLLRTTVSQIFKFQGLISPFWSNESLPPTLSHSLPPLPFHMCSYPLSRLCMEGTEWYSNPSLSRSGPFPLCFGERGS